MSPGNAIDYGIVDFYNRSIKNSISSHLYFKTVEEINFINLIITRATGCGGIKIFVIKLYIPYLLSFLTHIVNFTILIFLQFGKIGDLYSKKKPLSEEPEKKGKS